MKAIGKYLASNALLVALVILACYQQYQVMELSRDVSWVSSDVEDVAVYADEALRASEKAAFFGEDNSDRLINIETGLEVGVYKTECR